MVIFPLLKVVKSSPVELGNKIGNYLVENVVSEVLMWFLVLNIVISDEYYLNSFNRMKDDTKFGFVTPNPEDTAVMVGILHLIRINRCI
jgi:arginyl-tRNA synthetase